MQDPSIPEANEVWVFEGNDLPNRRKLHPAAVFSSLNTAAAWLGAHRLSGLITSYCLDEPAFERSLRRGTVPLHERDGSLRQVWAGGEGHEHVENGELQGRHQNSLGTKQSSPQSDFRDIKVWVFTGSHLPDRRSTHPSAVFSSLDTAAAWLGTFQLSGVLTSYCLDEPAFERSLRLGTLPTHLHSGEVRQVWDGGEERHHVIRGVILGASDEVKS